MIEDHQYKYQNDIRYKCPEKFLPIPLKLPNFLRPISFDIIASEESFLLSHMGPPKNAIKSLILVLEQFCIKHFLFLFQF